MPWCTIDAVPQLNPKKPRFNGCFPNRAGTPCCYKTRNEKLRSGHAVHLRNGEIVTKFSEACESSSIVFKGPWKHAVSHNHSSPDDEFWGKEPGLGVHMCDTVRGQPGSETVCCWDMWTERAKCDPVLQI